jgi:hypothetical protein
MSQAGRNPHDRPTAASPLPPAWVSWLLVGLTTMLAVLFGVTLLRSLELARRFRELEGRLQMLERSQILERSNVLEEQLRVMLGRLDALEEGAASRLEELEGERRRLEGELRRRQAAGDLRSPLVSPDSEAPARSPAADGPSPTAPPPPPSRGPLAEPPGAGF